MPLLGNVRARLVVIEVVSRLAYAIGKIVSESKIDQIGSHELFEPFVAVALEPVESGVSWFDYFVKVG